MTFIDYLLFILSTLRMNRLKWRLQMQVESYSFLSGTSVQFSHSVMSNSVTSWTAAHQASPSVGFSRQQYWSGLPFPSPLMVVIRINLFHHIRRENFYLQFFLNLNKSFYFSILNTIKRLEIAFEDLSLIWKHLICLFIYMYMTV